MRKEKQIEGQEFFRETSGMVAWLRVLVLVCSVAPVFIVLLVDEMHPRERLIVLIMEVSVALVINALFLGMRLELALTSAGVFYKLKPFQGKYRFIERKMIESAALQKGNVPGYGARRRGFGDRAIKMNDGPGLKIWLKDGKSLFFSTRKPEAMRGAIELLRSPGEHYAKSY